jgi:hypothetical protein
MSEHEKLELNIFTGQCEDASIKLWSHHDASLCEGCIYGTNGSVVQCVVRITIAALHLQWCNGLVHVIKSKCDLHILYNLKKKEKLQNHSKRRTQDSVMVTMSKYIFPKSSYEFKYIYIHALFYTKLLYWTKFSTVQSSCFSIVQYFQGVGCSTDWYWTWFSSTSIFFRSVLTYGYIIN